MTPMTRARTAAALLLAAWVLSALAAPPAEPASAPAAASPASGPLRAPPPTTPFAVVGDTVIGAADYQRALAVAMRRKYYHAKPPEAELQRFQREVGDEVVNRVLLLAEARRRGIQPDRERIQATVAGYERQYGGSEAWKTGRERMLAGVVPQLESESLLDRLEKLVKTVPEPDEAQARAYYDAHQALFIEPEQVKLGVILLRVDPSSNAATWKRAQAEAAGIHQRLRAGADFRELAKLHSADRSAARGGELDYTHRGMLPEAVHGIVDKLTPGALSEPVRLLEGYVLLRLEGRKPAVQRSFEQVRERAGDLWQREQAAARWQALIAQLRAATPVRVDENHYAPRRGPSDKPQAG